MTATPINKALYNKVLEEGRRKFDVWPSAYGSAWLVKTYKKRGGTYSGSKGPVKKPKRENHLRNPSVNHLRNQGVNHPRNPGVNHPRNPSVNHPRNQGVNRLENLSLRKNVQNIACVRARLLDVWLKKNAEK
jgi:hypothetical protein